MGGAKIGKILCFGGPREVRSFGTFLWFFCVQGFTKWVRAVYKYRRRRWSGGGSQWFFVDAGGGVGEGLTSDLPMQHYVLVIAALCVGHRSTMCWSSQHYVFVIAALCVCHRGTLCLACSRHSPEGVTEHRRGGEIPVSITA